MISKHTINRILQRYPDMFIYAPDPTLYKTNLIFLTSKFQLHSFTSYTLLHNALRAICLPIQKQVTADRCWVEGNQVNVRWMFTAKFLSEYCIEGVDRYTIDDEKVVKHEIVSVLRSGVCQKVKPTPIPAGMFAKEMQCRWKVK